MSTRGHGTANRWTLELATKAAKPLTSGPGGDYRPSWSPDGKWIAFASGRGSEMPFAAGRWERLQVAEIYLIHPDGSGLKKLTTSGNFCGSPKWTPDSKSVQAYCMTAQQTMSNRLGVPGDPGKNDTRLIAIDVMTSTSRDIAAGPGVKINPSPLGASEIGYVKKGAAPEAVIYYLSGKRGPAGRIRTASWSADGGQVVFDRRVVTPPVAIRKMFCRNPHYELNLTGQSPSFSPSGRQFVVGSPPSANGTPSLLSVVTAETGNSQVLYQDKSRNVLPGGWSPDGKRIIFGIGKFEAFFDGFKSQIVKPEQRAESGAQVAIVNADGTGFEELTALTTPAGPANSAFPSFAPDVKRFVYRTFSKDGNGLRIMNLETKAVRTLTGEYDNFPLWSPAGELIMFARLSGGTYEPGGRTIFSPSNRTARR